MEDMVYFNSIEDYNRFNGFETLHPLVSVIDFSKTRKSLPDSFTINYGVYAIFLKQTMCGDIRYGRRSYDYGEGTVVSFAPGQVARVQPNNAQPKALGLIFHPDLIRGTSLGQEIKHYSFFGYNSTEALHLSEREKTIFEDCLSKIRQELEHAIDKHSKRLIVRNIELLLDYCMRFYERQFITRSDADNDTLARFERLIDEYFEQNRQVESGLPTVKYFADKVCLSANYFGDYIKKATGRTAQDYIRDKIMDMAKEKMAGSDMSVSEVAYWLGFQYPQHFSRMFKRSVGVSPNEYRNAN